MARQSANGQDERFTTIKVREPVRRWIKMKAAEKGISMYELVEEMLSKAADGTPWEAIEGS